MDARLSALCSGATGPLPRETPLHLCPDSSRKPSICFILLPRGNMASVAILTRRGVVCDEGIHHRVAQTKETRASCECTTPTVAFRLRSGMCLLGPPSQRHTLDDMHKCRAAGSGVVLFSLMVALCRPRPCNLGRFPRPVRKNVRPSGLAMNARLLYHVPRPRALKPLGHRSSTGCLDWQAANNGSLRAATARPNEAVCWVVVHSYLNRWRPPSLLSVTAASRPPYVRGRNLLPPLPPNFGRTAGQPVGRHDEQLDDREKKKKNNRAERYYRKRR